MSYFGSELEQGFSKVLREHEAFAFRMGLVLGVLCAAALVLTWCVPGWWKLLAGLSAACIIVNTLVIATGLSK